MRSERSNDVKLVIESDAAVQNVVAWREDQAAAWRQLTDYLREVVSGAGQEGSASGWGA